MSYFDEARDLAQEGSDFRKEIFGVNQSGSEQTLTGEGITEPVPCYFTPVRDRQQLDEANMKQIHDGIVRIQKSTGFVPRLGQVVTLIDAKIGGGDLTVRLDEFGHSVLNPEFVIGVGSNFD